MKNFAIACGGTGGHISPGIAISEQLQSHGNNATLVVSEKAIDSTMLKKYSQIEKFIINAKPLTKNFKKFPIFIYSHFVSFFRCLKFIKTKKIDAVIGFGGFTNMPLILAAFILRKKIFLHESNQVIGKSIKVLARFADLIFLPHNTQNQLSCNKKKLIEAGYPLRKEIQKHDKCESRKFFNIDQNKFTILVFGGSQGAKALIDWTIENQKNLAELNVQIVCICGNNYPEKVVDNTTFIKFCNNMAYAYSAADLIIARAGAGTIAEIQHLNIPTILIPYPFAANLHQHANAQAASEISGFTTIDQKNIGSLFSKINNIVASNKTLQNMFESFLINVNPNWARFITETIENHSC